MRVTLRAGANLYIYGCQISFSPKNDVVISSKDARNYEKPAKLRRYANSIPFSSQGSVKQQITLIII